MKYKIKAICFDFDNTIIDTDYIHYIAFKKALFEKTKKVISFKLYKEAEFLKTIDRYKLFGIKKITISKIKSIQIYKNILYLKHKKHLKLKPNFKKLLKLLKKNKIKTSLVTNGNTNTIKKIIQYKKLKFNTITTSKNNLRKKPHPEMYIYTKNKLQEKYNIKAKEIIVIEDSLIGMESAKNAGLKVLSIKSSNNNNKLIKSISKNHFNNYKEIIYFLEPILMHHKQDY